MNKDYTVLINALDAAALRVENDPACYMWCDFLCCNCGLVAQEILNIKIDLRREFSTRDKLARILQPTFSINNKQFDVWSGFDSAISYCRQTNTLMPVVLDKLFMAGFSEGDFENFEMLADPKVRERAGLFLYKKERILDFDQAEAFIKYCRAWAQILKEKMDNYKSLGQIDEISDKELVAV